MDLSNEKNLLAIPWQDVPLSDIDLVAESAGEPVVYLVPGFKSGEKDQSIVFFGLQAALHQLETTWDTWFEEPQITISALPEGIKVRPGTPCVEICSMNRSGAKHLFDVARTVCAYMEPLMNGALQGYQLRTAIAQHNELSGTKLSSMVHTSPSVCVGPWRQAVSTGWFTAFDVMKPSMVWGNPYLQEYLYDPRTHRCPDVFLFAGKEQCSIHSQVSSTPLYESILKQAASASVAVNVSDDLPRFLNKTLPALRAPILKRQGRVCFCIAQMDKIPMVAQTLWNNFGGSIDNNELRTLNNHVRLGHVGTHGPDEFAAVCKALVDAKFSLSNLYFWTAPRLNDEVGLVPVCTQVKTITEAGTVDVRSPYSPLQGRCVVFHRKSGDGHYPLCVDRRTEKDCQSMRIGDSDLLQPVFQNGKILKMTTLDLVRARLWSDEGF